MRLRFFIFFLLLLSGIRAEASHIVGGEVTYTCLGGHNYQVSITIYEDCINGDPDAIAQDNPAFISIFENVDINSFGHTQLGFDSLSAPSISIPANFSNACINNPPSTCLRKRTFVGTYNLPPNDSGYIIVYQRCCRNATVLNILNPSQKGATYYCTIPPENVAICNNSAVFKNFPPQIICINNPLVYDHSATDADGDSLSYEFCAAYSGGSENNAKPVPSAPPFDSLDYRSPFSYSNPMSGFPPIQIDPISGLITGTPNLLGRFVVTVCCHEWRNGMLINTVKREFQFVVTNCSKAVVANIPQYSSDFNTYIVNCKDYTVHFANQSTGGFSYEWDFGTGATSTDFEPTYTFPDTGVYMIKLVVNPGSTCPDSITRYVKIFPKFIADFSDSGLFCPNMPISFMDRSIADYNPINKWMWDFGDSATSLIQNPVHSFSPGGTYNVTLVSGSARSCLDTVVKQVSVDNFIPFAGNDTVIVRNEIINFNATGGDIYTWSPSTYLSDTTISNPVGHYPDTGMTSYVVHITSEVGCQGFDTINVHVVNQPSFFLPSGFTPNGDGHNDVFRPVSVGFRALKFFRIYNRWGQLIFESKSFEKAWDGTFNHTPCELGTYYWQIGATDRYGNDVKAKGDVQLIR